MIESISRGGGGREGGRETRGGKEKFLRYHEEPYQISREAEGERDSPPPPLPPRVATRGSIPPAFKARLYFVLSFRGNGNLL